MAAIPVAARPQLSNRHLCSVCYDPLLVGTRGAAAPVRYYECRRCRLVRTDDIEPVRVVRMRASPPPPPALHRACGECGVATTCLRPQPGQRHVFCRLCKLRAHFGRFSAADDANGAAGPAEETAAAAPLPEAQGPSRRSRRRRWDASPERQRERSRERDSAHEGPIQRIVLSALRAHVAPVAADRLLEEMREELGPLVRLSDLRVVLRTMQRQGRVQETNAGWVAAD